MSARREDREFAESHRSHAVCVSLVCPNMQARCVGQPSFVHVEGRCPALAACVPFCCGCAAGSGAAAGLAGSPCPALQEPGAGQGWMSPCPSQHPHCPPHSAGEGEWRGDTDSAVGECNSLVLSALIRAWIVSACSFNEETTSGDSSSKPNLASSPCR